MKILVSACLLGIACRYDGNAKRNTALTEILQGHEIVPFCPEIYGGLPTPREPAEIRGSAVLTRSGRDVTAEYQKGADEAVKIAQTLGCDCAVLQDRSPSCGVGKIHNGAFDGGIIDGNGITVRALQSANIPTYSASEIVKIGIVPRKIV